METNWGWGGGVSFRSGLQRERRHFFLFLYGNQLFEKTGGSSHCLRIHNLELLHMELCAPIGVIVQGNE